jgi:predicted nuclease with TOPRIM domain
MVGKGSVSHNSRKFHAANTDPARSDLNRSYCNENIRQVYREMFDGAVSRYNEKQTRNDRMIEDYYEKIRSSKQEKPFHEIILQIGNKDDMNAQTENGEIAVKILDKYMQSFQSRNPNMRVFSAHLHMDEATPHLHIDFVPFTTGSKRGLDTRVSLKQALAAQGFHGGSRQETEWNQWVVSEKEKLAAVMERHGILWEHKGTHEKHLSVLDYEKKKRAEEVAQLEVKIGDLQGNVVKTQKSADKIQARLDKLQERENLIDLNVGTFDNDPKWQLPEPGMLMTANSYKSKIVEPFIRKMKKAIGSIIAQYLHLKTTVNDLKSRLSRAYADNDRLTDRIDKIGQENTRLVETVKDYRRVRKVLGEEQTDNIISRAKIEEQALKRPMRSKGYYER